MLGVQFPGGVETIEPALRLSRTIVFVRCAALFAIVTALVTACGGEINATEADGGSSSIVSVCVAPGRCPNDAPQSPAAIEACNSMLDGPCGAQLVALDDCAEAGIECDSAGASVFRTSACAAESAAYARCTADGDGGTPLAEGGQGGDAAAGDAGATTCHEDFTWVEESCRICMDAMCCAEQVACESGLCGDYLGCFKQCQSDAPCQSTCADDYDDGGQAWTDLEGCYAQNCATAACTEAEPLMLR